jgi:DNA topoisomerase-3
VPTLPGVVAALQPAYPGLAAVAQARKEPLSKAYVDDTKLTDHHAIIPTTKPAPANLGPDEAKMYDLVCRRFLAIFHPPRLTERTEATLTIASHTFRAVGLVEKQQGWTVALPPASSPDPDDAPEADGQDARQQLPPLAVGQVVQKLGQKLLAKKTTPPRPFNEATLLAAMKSASDEVDDEALAEHMKECGLGTAATRAEIIEKLIRTDYVERKKTTLVATPKGEGLITQVAPELADPKLTAEWEQRLAAIEDGKDNLAAFERDIAAYVRRLVPEVLAMSDSEVMPASTNPDSLGTCPGCNKGQVREMPKGWGCSRYKEEPACRFVIWKELAGKTLTATVVKELLANGVTKKPVEGFKSKEGKPFSAKLKLDDNQKLVFAFDEKPAATPGDPLGTCPACGQGQVRATPKGWGCSEWKAGCKFTVWRTNYGKDITEAVVRELLTNRTTEKIEGFKSKDGKPFSARLVIDDAFKVVAAHD